MRTMTGIRVEQITHAEFADFIASRPKIIAVLAHYGVTKFAKKVADYFGAEFGASIRFGRMDMSAIPYKGWAMKHVGSVVTADVLGRAPEGYYLFVDGTATAYHSGQPNQPGGDGGALILGLVGMLANSRGLTEAAASTLLDNIATRVIEHFEPILARHAAAPPKPDWSKVFASVSRHAGNDPYAILGVPRNVSEEDARKAFKIKMRQNHPDKVSHLSAAIQETAKRETARIREAYDAIKAERGW